MKTALVVDDSFVVRTVARSMLESFAFAVSEAEGGDMAFESCRLSVPDLILLDWQMPGMDGYAFLKHLRGLPQGRHPKVVFCSAERDLMAIGLVLQAGADEYIVKPFTRDILADKLAHFGFVEPRRAAVRGTPIGEFTKLLKRPQPLLDRLA